MTEPGDDRINAAFEALRAEDRRRTPDFGGMLSPPRRARPSGLLLATAAVFVVLVAWAGLRALNSDPVPDFTMGSLRMPTDFLLDLPGSALVTTMPAIGRTDDWFPGALGMKGTS